MKKFIRIENTIINLDNVESVSENLEVVKYGKEVWDADEKEVQGIRVNMINSNCGGYYVFKSITLEKFLEMVDE